MAIPAKVLKWRETLPRGAIMRPSTFKKIVQKAKKAGYDDPYAVAGRAYYTTLMAKAKRAGVTRNPRTKEKAYLDFINGRYEIIIYTEEGSYHKYFPTHSEAELWALKNGYTLMPTREALYRHRRMSRGHRKNPGLRLQYYVGFNKRTRKPVVFPSSKKPTVISHGRKFHSVVGPFKSRHEAEVYRNRNLNI